MLICTHPISCLIHSRKYLLVIVLLSGQSSEFQDVVSYTAKFMGAVRLWKKQEEEKKVRRFEFNVENDLVLRNKMYRSHLTVLFVCPQMLLKKVAQLEEAWTQKDKFIHSSRMIIRFREEHISRLEKKLKAGQSFLSDMESQALIDQLKKEIKILSDQVKY